MNKLTTLILAVLVCSITYVTLSGQGNFSDLQQIEAEVTALEADSLKMKREIQYLETTIARSASDAIFLETAAREELALTQPGEIVYLFSSEEQGAH